RHALGQVDEAVVLEDLDPADVLRVQLGLVGDRAHDVARLHPVVVADLDAEGLHARLRRARHAFLLREGRAVAAPREGATSRARPGPGRRGRPAPDAARAWARP